MELMPGYRETEIGIFPRDWQIKPFSEVFSFQNGVNADKAAYGKGIRFINVLEPITFSHIRGPEIPGRVSLAEAAIASYVVRYGDIVLNRTSETQDEVGLASVYLGSELVVFGGFVIRGRPLSNDFDPVYSGFALRAPCIRKQIVPMGQGAIRANIGQQSLQLVHVPVPPQSEQRAIATALSDVDALLAGLDRLIAKKRDLKQAAMQQLLTGKTRLPGFEGEWVFKPIGNEIDLLTGFPFPSNSYTESGIRLLRGSNIKRGNTDWNDEITQYWPEVTPTLKGYLLQEGDIVIAMDGSLVGRSFAQISRTDLPALLLQRVARVRSSKIEIDYLKSHICSPYFTAHCDSVKTVTAIPHISPSDIREYEIGIPPTRDEQRAIATVLSDMDAEIEALEQRRAKTADLKQAMMQELLTGKTRLITPEVADA